MGGQSSSQQQQTQNSTTAPWTASQPLMTGILDQLKGFLPQTGATGAQTSSLDAIENNARNFGQFNPQATGAVGELLSGGGATSYSPQINQGYQDYMKRLQPTADGAMIGQNSGLKPYLDTIRSDVTNQVNGQFAGAGRDFSGMNFQTLGRGIAQGEAPVIAAQYNTDVGNQRSAADALYGGSNTNYGILSGLQQQGLQNKVAGVNAIPGAMSATNAGPNEILQAEAQRLGIPVENLGMLARLGIPIAGLGSQSSGTATGNTTNQMSGADQFAKIAGGIGALNPFRFVFGGK